MNQVMISESGLIDVCVLRTIFSLVAILWLASCTTGDLPPKEYYAIALSPDGSTLAVSADTGLYLYDTNTLEEVWFTRRDVRPLWRLTFSPNGTKLASIAAEEVALWDTRTGKRLHAVPWEAQPVDLRFSPDSTMLAVADGQYEVTVWDAEVEQKINTIGLKIQGFHTGPPEVWSVAWSQSDMTLAAVLGWPDSSGITVWNPKTDERLHISQGFRCADKLAFSPDGKTLASTSIWQSDVVIWDVQVGEPVSRLGELPPVTSLTWSPDGDQLVVALGDNTLQAWDPETNEMQWVLRGHTDPVFLDGLAFRPNGKALLSASRKEVIVWDIETGEQLNALHVESFTE